MDTIIGIKTFIAVVKAGSFTNAAEQLGLSTALVSKYVGQLENRLGIRLLRRTTRSLTLTELGQVYFDRSQSILEDFEALESAIQDKTHQPSGQLVISGPITFGEQHLTSAIAKFMRQYPDVRVDLRLTDRFVSLADEGIDVAIRIGALGDSSLVARKLDTAELIVCATAAYLNKKGEPQTPEELLQHKCVIDTNFHGGTPWEFTSKDDKKHSIRVDGPFKVNSAAAALDMVLQDMGIGLIPAYAINSHLTSGRLTPLLLEYQTTQLGIYAAYAQQRYLATKIRAFIDFMVDHPFSFRQ